MEHQVKQRTPEWFDLRRHVVVTASCIADAVGGGRGKPYDFLLSLFQDEDDCNEDNMYTLHGKETEPVVHEAYDLLTGYSTRNSGFWTITDDDNPLKGKIGASPDAVILDDNTQEIIGICEFKAPVHTLYKDIPRQHMIQMQAQMAITGMTWCDFMAICIKTKQLMFKRVHFCPHFWSFISRRLIQFCEAYQEISSREADARNVFNANINAIKQWTASKSPLPYESKIQCIDMLQKNPLGNSSIIGPSKFRFNFDLLVGSFCNTSFSDAMYRREIEKLDEAIDKEGSEENDMICIEN